MAPSSFTPEKRQFLLTKLDDIIKLCPRGNGQGYFYFTVSEGMPNLQTGLEIGLEDDPLQQPPPPQHQHVPGPCYQGYQDLLTRARKRRVRGPVQIAKNRARAAAHQAKQRAASQSKVAAASEATSAAAVKLPFSGNILTLKKIPGTASPAPQPSSGRSSPSTPSPTSSTPSYAAVVSAAAPPVKKAGPEFCYPNNSSAKKKLFSAEYFKPPPPQILPVMNHRPGDLVSSVSNFKKKEDDIFARIFS